MDWNGYVIPLVGKDDGHIYDLTISVNVSTDDGNIICVDMRNIFPDRYKNCKTRQGHAMFKEFRPEKIDGVKKYKCYNSWGEKDKVIYINIDEPSATKYMAYTKKCVRRGYDGRPD